MNKEELALHPRGGGASPRLPFTVLEGVQLLRGTQHEVRQRLEKLSSPRMREAEEALRHSYLRRMGELS